MVHVPSNPRPMSSSADQPASYPDRDPAVAARVEQLYASHADLVRSICRSLLRDRSEAEDAIQQTFLSAQRALVNGSSPRDAAAWLATIARHECIARVRARMREPLPTELEEGEAASDVHTAAVRRHEAGELREALADLPAQQREAILLREVRGFSYQEVAASLSVTTSAVESLLFRARRSLQTRLQEALAALSPAAWVRELAARLAGGGLAGPAATKVAAVGLGTAVATGGALVGPTVIGLGHAPAPRTSSPPAVRHRLARATLRGPTLWAPAAPHPTRVAAVSHPNGGEGDSGSAAEVSDRQSSSDTRGSEHSSETTSSAAGDGSGSTRETGDGGTTVRATGVSERSAIDSASTDSASGTTATDSGSGD
jgi:RNA polymerase sigma factor (sigma-70 family)